MTLPYNENLSALKAAEEKIKVLQARLEELEELKKAAFNLDELHYRHPEDGHPYDQTSQDFIEALDKVRKSEALEAMTSPLADGLSAAIAKKEPVPILAVLDSMQPHEK